MITLRLTPRARKDLDSIWDHTAGQWGMNQANAYLRAVNQTFELLRLNPGIGRDASEIIPGFLKFPTGSHVIYYRLGEKSLDVIRVLHKSMDAERHL